MSPQARTEIIGLLDAWAGSLIQHVDDAGALATSAIWSSGKFRGYHQGDSEDVASRSNLAMLEAVGESVYGLRDLQQRDAVLVRHRLREDKAAPRGAYEPALESLRIAFRKRHVPLNSA
jgi:hypothetical protein